jgi:NitT/TauT family transport system substrate-binding protein
MMKKMKTLVLLLLCMLLLVSCAKNKDNTAAAPEETITDAVTPTAEPASDAATDNQAAAEETEATQTPVEKTDIKIAALKGATAIGMVKLMEDASNATAANNYQFTVAGTADEITAGLMKGDFDVAAVPCNLASVLYNKTEGQIKLAGINTLGVLYIVETGDTIKTVEDLKGKTIYSTGIGTTPQYTLNYLLSSYGIDPEKDVTIEYKAEATEVAAMLTEADNAIAMLPQPYVTTVLMSNDKVRIALDVAKEWEAVNKDSSVVTGVVVVRKQFLEENPDAFAAFLEEYKLSAEYANTNLEEASALVEKYGIFKAAPVKKAIPYCNITLITGEEMKTKVGGYLQTLFDQNPQSVGGKLPADDFYYMP